MPPCAEGVGVDPVDLPGDGEAAELEAALELDRGRARPEPDLEAARHEREAELELLLHEVLEVARKVLLELEPLEVGDVEPDAAGDRLDQAFAQEDEGLVQAVGLDSVRSEALRQPAVKAVERLVRNAAAHARVQNSVDLLRGDHPLEEPHGRAIEEALELRYGEAGSLRELLDDERAGVRLAVERRQRALDPPLPAVGQRERAGLVLVRGRDGSGRAKPLALRRAALELHERLDSGRFFVASATSAGSNRERTSS